MARRPFRLSRSRTGLGLFAIQAIKKRTRLAEYKGPRLRLKEAEAAEKRGNRYLFEVNSRWTIDGKARSNIARYFNHSCNANTDVTIRQGRVFVYTLRAIKPDEELTFDYGRDYLKNVIGLSNCRCSRCRKRRAKRSRELRELRQRRLARAAQKSNSSAKTVAAKTTVAKTKSAKTAAAKTKSAKTKTGKTKSAAAKRRRGAG